MKSARDHPRVRHLSTYEQRGGAARACHRLHGALREQGIDSRLQVARRDSPVTDVVGGNSARARMLAIARPLIARTIKALQRPGDPEYRSLGLLPSRQCTSPTLSGAEVLHLHWVGNEFLSVAEIGRITEPVVWTLHDMWAFCGAEHYADDDPDARWRQGYDTRNRPRQHVGIDLDRLTWQRKQRAWRTPMPLVCPSRWLADCARGSALLSDWPVRVIPYALDPEVFRPLPRSEARLRLGLPIDRPLVLFGAIGGTRDPRKGWRHVVEAMGDPALRASGLSGMVFGEDAPSSRAALPVPVHWAGRIGEDALLAVLYSAADVFVLPSLRDNLPLTGMEAQACGCPVVAFDATGLPDVVEHGETGYLARPFEAEDLARGIRFVLEDEERRARLSANARARAVRLWAPEVVVPQYLDLYREVLERHRGSAGR